MNELNKIKIINKALIFFVFCASQIQAQGQADTVLSKKINVSDSLAADKIKFIAYPYAFYTPETQLAIGAGALVYFRTSPALALQPSKILVSGYYTTNNQFALTIAPRITFAGSDGVIIDAKFYYGKEIWKFYGIGNQTPEIPDPDYKKRGFGIMVDVSARNIISESINTGLIFDFSNDEIYDYENNPELNDSAKNIEGISGGVVSGLGLSFLYDDRDNAFYPSTNGFYQIKFFYYGKYLGSKYNYSKFQLDLRRFFSIIDDNIIALQLYFEAANGDIPFFKLAALGGPYRMRGYFEGRYRDKDYLVFQAEYRKMIWWRFGLAVFYSIGDVAPSLSAYRLSGFKHSYGFGIRFVFDETEKVNIRVDAGFGKGTNGIYFSIEEAF